MQEILTNLNIDWRIILVNLLGFIGLLYTANLMVFKPISKVIEDRQSDVQKTYDQLDADQAQMRALKADYEQRLSAIEAEGRERINNMIKEAQVTRDSVLSDATTRAHDLVTRAEAEAAREKEQSLITLRTQVAELAIGAAERVVKGNLNDARSRQLVDDFITENGGVAPNHAAAAVIPPAAPAPAPVTVSVPVVASAPAPVAEAKPEAHGIGGGIAAALVAGATLVAGAVMAVTNAAAHHAEHTESVSAPVPPVSTVATQPLVAPAEPVAVDMIARPEIGTLTREGDDAGIQNVESAATAVQDASMTAKKPRAPRKKTDEGGAA